MGSQTLEILRQGVWASLTGGWFYDPHQNLFCNTVHLYIWLFLLCLPFSVYLYFPPALLGWAIYCILVALVFSCLKLINHGLHHIYDTTECIVVTPQSSDANPSNENNEQGEGMEMQMLRTGHIAATGSDNESITSLEYHKPNNSTIDLKVDVHRKNSSESSMEDSVLSTKQVEPVALTKSDLCAQGTDTASASKSQTGRRVRTGHKRESKANRCYQGSHPNRIIEINKEEGNHADRTSKTEDSIVINLDDGPFAKVSRRYYECPHRRGSNFSKDFFKEWLYLDANEAAGEPYQSKFARQLSSDSRDNSEPSAGPTSPKKRLAHRRCYVNYPHEHCTKSSTALAMSQSSNMRRNSNSTMSTIQLPLLNSTAQLVSHMRRHSNTADVGLFLPTGSVELGAYMMEKAEKPCKESDEKSKGKIQGVRRIKSAALEIGCPPPSVSNLSPHPNSAETIGGQVLKNPKNAVIPPPSKCLMRGPHLNLYPKVESSEGCSYPYLNYGSEIVYPIAEISDEMQTSQKETDLDSSGDSYSDYDDENSNMRHQFRGFDWDADQSPGAQSSDSEFENNGSRSPLLDRTCETRVVRARNQNDYKKHACCDKHLSSKVVCDSCTNEKVKTTRLKKISKSECASEIKNVTENCNHLSKNIDIVDSINNVENLNTESSKTVSDTIASLPIDYFDKSSASSKDFLIEKSSLESNEYPLDLHENENSHIKHSVEKKLWDHEISNSSSSSDSNDNQNTIDNEASGLYKIDIKDCGLIISDAKSVDERSLYSIEWLFEEENHTSYSPSAVEADSPSQTLDHAEKCPRALNALGETSSNIQKNLGAIPKQIKNLARSRASSQKENKKRDSRKEKDENQNDEMILLDAVEAQAALVQGLECLFAATNANTVVMPPLNREERPRSHRQHSVREGREHTNKTRKCSIEEVAQTSTNTLLPTSMPLLAAFLNSRVDFPHIPICLPDSNNPINSDTKPPAEETQRFRPLMERNHRNRVRKIKRSTRQRNNPSSQSSADRHKGDKAPTADNSNNVHFATSFEDTTDGAIHCFMDEYGNWMSYTFDKNSTGRVQVQPITLSEKTDSTKCNQVKPIDSLETAPDNTASVGSCGSLESDPDNGTENSINNKRSNGVDQNSSNQSSSNPLLSSTNNVSAVVPININNVNKRFYVFDGGTGSHNDQPRSPVAYVTDSLLEQIEAERQSRMGLPSMHINFLMSQQRANQRAENVAELRPSIPLSGFELHGLSGSIGEDSVDLNVRNKFSKLMDAIEKANQPKPKSYYKVKLLRLWEIKVTLDRLKLMALFDRNLTFMETFISIILAILVSVLGSMTLQLGIYRDIYAFWFCFIIAGSQYSLLKSVQPDSASPVHGFNKMVVFSRPVYFCLCTAILCGVHNHLVITAPEPDRNDFLSRTKRSVDASQFTIYGFTLNERDLLHMVKEVLSKFILFFPLAFSLGLFPQVNTFLMYLLEQIDMHIFGGNATNSLSAAVYCVVRSLAAVGVLYGFAYSGLVEEKKSQHILFSIFCGLLVPISYHLSRSASDYSLIWNLIKKHLLPPELYVIHNPECTVELEKGDPNTLSNQSKKNNSEGNISKENSISSSTSKINFSSETNISKTQKRSQTSSVSSLKFDPRGGDGMTSSGSLKIDATIDEDKNNNKQDNTEKNEEDMSDPLPQKLQATVNARLKNDVIVCTFLTIVVFGLHCTTVFTTLRPQLIMALWIIAAILGWILHYLIPQLRKQQPWLCLAGPVLRQHEHAQFEVSEPARIMWFEKVFVYLSFLERNILYPAVLLSATTQDAPIIAEKFGYTFGAFIVCICSLKCLRNAYSEPDSQYLILIFAVLLFQRDFSSKKMSETFLVDYFITAIIFNKVYEFLLKIQFVVTYIAPWQITWGSAFHAFAQPFSVPHSAMLFLQAAVSALLSTPLTPALGSAIFMTSYVRPVKFWERDYNTKRVDQSNTRLSSQLERNLGADDNNLNSIFYEHLTRSLQHYLCGDLMLGRWGQVQQGDCFVLASDYLNCLVHIVELGNGLVSFQLRGLEFRGTYCQQREVEAISEGPEESSDGVCAGWWCAGRVLSPGAAFSLRWLAWQLASTKYVLEGYSVSDNSAVSMLQVFDFRKVLITYYVKSIIYYTIQSSKLDEWLSSPTLAEALKHVSEKNFVDLDPIFNGNLDDDYDFRASGITRNRFCTVYHDWVLHCGGRRDSLCRRRGIRALGKDSQLVSLCFALSLVGRRALAAASHHAASSVEFFLYGLHSLFKGDFRITCARDEWVFTDMSLLHSVLAPAVRMALKLHQDHFMFPDEYCNSTSLYTAITGHSQRLVICHEAAPAWRYNVLRGAPHLLALRHVMDEGNDDYKIIMLNKRHLGFRVIKLNRECVRGLWAGQQQELVYLRNRNPERGSIQNAKQALRNIINSSCDQPIGYPIYVSPLTTSYADTSEQLSSLVGGPVSVQAIKNKAIALWRRIRRRCGEGCSSGGGACDVAAAEAGTARAPATLTPRHNTLHLSRTSLAGTRGSLASAGKPTSSTLASLAGLLREHSHERSHEDSAYGSNEPSEARRRSEERLPPNAGLGSGATGPTGGRRDRDSRSRGVNKEPRQNMAAMERAKDGRNRARRERTRPASFRLLAATERDAPSSTSGTTQDSLEMHALPDSTTQGCSGGAWDGSWREHSRRNVTSKSAARIGTPDSSFEELPLGNGAPDVSLPDCRIIANRCAAGRHATSEFKRYIQDTTSKELSKISKDIKHERESYRELTGKYSELPIEGTIAMKELAKYSDLSGKESNLKIDKKESKKDDKSKTKVKRSDSGKTELKMNVSVGTKVMISEPLGVYDCINLGRRIDVQWPSENQRERGGRNFWGSWVPLAGMYGLVVHKWTPNHRDPKLRSHVDKSILLVEIGDKFVPIAENCVQDLGDEV